MNDGHDGAPSQTPSDGTLDRHCPGEGGAARERPSPFGDGGGAKRRRRGKPPRRPSPVTVSGDTLPARSYRIQPSLWPGRSALLPFRGRRWREAPDEGGRRQAPGCFSSSAVIAALTRPGSFPGGEKRGLPDARRTMIAVGFGERTCPQAHPGKFAAHRKRQQSVLSRQAIGADAAHDRGSDWPRPRRRGRPCRRWILEKRIGSGSKYPTLCEHYRRVPGLTHCGSRGCPHSSKFYGVVRGVQPEWQVSCAAPHRNVGVALRVYSC